MDLSVVMPVRNGLPYLPEAINSVLTQSYLDFEVLLIDDGSTDGSYEYVKMRADYDKRIRVLKNPTSGLVSALNFGVGQSAGTFIARMDSDDVCLPDRFLRQLNFLQQNSRLGAVGSYAQYVDAQGVPLCTRRVPTAPPHVKRYLNFINPVVHPTVMMRKDAVQVVGLYRERFLAAEDYDLWLRLSERYDIGNIPEVLLKYRVHGSNSSLLKRKEGAQAFIFAQYCAEERRCGRSDPGEVHRLDSSDSPMQVLSGEWDVMLRTFMLNEHVESGRRASDDDVRLLISLLKSGGSLRLSERVLWLLSKVTRRALSIRVLLRVLTVFLRRPAMLALLADLASFQVAVQLDSLLARVREQLALQRVGEPQTEHQN